MIKQASSHLGKSACKIAYKIKIPCAYFSICLMLVSGKAMLSSLLCFPDKTLRFKFYMALKCFPEFLRVIPFLFSVTLRQLCCLMD